MYSQIMLYNRTKELERTAISWIKMYDPIVTGVMDKPYYVAYSGGKDSDVLRILFELAGAKHDLENNHTTVDTPETVRYIRSIPNIKISYSELSMWELIIQYMFPPTRSIRYCCEHLKERSGAGRFLSTGVRWEESSNRKANRGFTEILGSSKNNNIILNSDNDENRRIIENCQIKGKRILNPIVNWSTNDVWEFLNYYNCKSNPLYERGYTRVGCIGCPFSKNREKTLEEYPTYKRAYIRTFDKMLDARRSKGLKTQWQSGNDVYSWWISKPKKNNLKIMDGQIEMDFNLDINVLMEENK